MKKIALLFFLLLSVRGAHAQSWTPLSVGISSDVLDISFPAEDTGFASLSNGTIRKTVDGALNWSIIPSPNSFSGNLEFISASRGFILTDSGITVTNNAGLTWSVAFDNPNVNWYDIYFVNTSVGYATGPGMQSSDSTFVYKTLDGGVTWNSCTVVHDWGAQVPYFHFRTTTEGYLFGGDSVHRTTDGGLTWISVYADPAGGLISTLSAPDPTTAYCIDMNSAEIVKSLNGGVTWNPTGQFMGNPAWASHFVNASLGFMCGGNGINAGYIAQTVNGGTSWTNPIVGNTTFWCMDFPSGTTGYCGGTAGVIMKYSGPLSVQDHRTNAISVYPNPATDFITVENAEVGAVIRITNSLGQVVRSEVATDSRMRINVADLAEGVYFCEMTASAGKQVARIVIE